MVGRKSTAWEGRRAIPDAPMAIGWEVDARRDESGAGDAEIPIGAGGRTGGGGANAGGTNELGGAIPEGRRGCAGSKLRLGAS